MKILNFCLIVITFYSIFCPHVNFSSKWVGNFAWNSAREFTDGKVALSSAYPKRPRDNLSSGCIYEIKMIGDAGEPCGSPHSIGSGPVYTPSRLTRAIRPERKKLNPFYEILGPTLSSKPEKQPITWDTIKHLLVINCDNSYNFLFLPSFSKVTKECCSRINSGGSSYGATVIPG